MQGIQAARACSINGQTWPCKVVEPTKAVREHSCAGTSCKILVVLLRITSVEDFVLSCEVADEDRGFGANDTLHGDTAYESQVVSSCLDGNEQSTRRPSYHFQELDRHSPAECVVEDPYNSPHWA
jgi:hypothetical protein